MKRYTLEVYGVKSIYIKFASNPYVKKNGIKQKLNTKKSSLLWNGGLLFLVLVLIEWPLKGCFFLSIYYTIWFRGIITCQNLYLGTMYSGPNTQLTSVRSSPI